MAQDPSYYTLPVLPLPLEPDELYVMLMQPIEPELLVAPAEIEKRYINESAEEKERRHQRYRKAFATFRQKYDAYMAEWKRRFSKYKRDMNGFVEQFEKLQQTDNL